MQEPCQLCELRAADFEHLEFGPICYVCADDLKWIHWHKGITPVRVKERPFPVTPQARGFVINVGTGARLGCRGSGGCGSAGSAITKGKRSNLPMVRDLLVVTCWILMVIVWLLIWALHDSYR